MNNNRMGHALPDVISSDLQQVSAILAMTEALVMRAMPVAEHAARRLVA